MLTFLSEFGMLFAVFGGLILTVAWRRGWFLDGWADSVAQQPREDDERSGEGAFEGALAPLRRLAQQPTAASTSPTNTLDASAEPDPAALAAARNDAVAKARHVYPTYWTKDVIQQRPGWMLFDPSDFLGDPGKRIDYFVRGTAEEFTLPLYQADQVRRVERENTLIATSRRKVITSRWERRRTQQGSTSLAGPAARQSTGSDAVQ